MKRRIIIFTSIILLGFLGWRFIRPMNIFMVDERFAWPIDTSQTTGKVADILSDLSAKQCANCHLDFYREWQTTIHSQAWTDPYFQTDWKFDDKQHNCRLCHTPLDKQQPQKVLAYRDTDKWEPVLEDNPEFDKNLQHEGVTCAACHYRDGKIVGVLGTSDAPHPVKKLEDPNQICVRCHIVEGERWDTFFRFPPCGTVAEIRKTQKDNLSKDESEHEPAASNAGGAPDDKLSDDADNNIDMKLSPKTMVTDTNTIDYSSLGCVQCHMPTLERPLVVGGKTYITRQHLWRGGHDPEMVRSAISFDFSESQKKDRRIVRLMMTNIGAAHYVPTGTPDRHLTVQLRLLDAQNQVIDEEHYTIKRTLMWRPFIIDLWDNRLKRWSPQQFEIEIENNSKAVRAEAVVKYHLLDEKRRQRIAYENKTPVNYEIFRKEILLLDVDKTGH